MRLFFPFLLVALSCSATARLADTIDQAEARYGLPKAEKTPAGAAPLLEQATHEYTFAYQGWKIRCAFLLATDGREYVVREDYTKEIAPGVYPPITEPERLAIFEGESAGQKWAERDGAAGRIWSRPDGAHAIFKAGILRLELPHAGQFEQQVAKLKVQNTPAVVLPRF